MGRWTKVGVLLLAGMLAPAHARAQLLWFSKKPAQEEPPAFSNGAPAPAPEFAGDPKSDPPGTPQFCPPPGSDCPKTPFLPIEEENRNAFHDFMFPPSPDPLCVWLKAEWLLWQVKQDSIGATVATTVVGPPNAVSSLGALDQPGTKSLFGPGNFGFGPVNGARITGGISAAGLPIEVGGFFLSRNRTQFQATSNNTLTAPVLAIPFQDPNLTLFPNSTVGIPAQLTSSAGFPALTTGSLAVNSTLNLWGIDSNLFFPVCASDMLFLDCFVGYRYLRLGESFQVTKTLSPVKGGPPIPFAGDTTDFGTGFSTVTQDQFGTSNQFNGGQLGTRAGLAYGRVALFFDGKLGLGQTQRQLNVGGSSTLITPAATLRGPSADITVPGGVLAVASNSGVFNSDAFSIIPEIDINIGFQLHRSVRLFAGYSLIYWTNVVRPGQQVNNSIDSRQIPTSANFVKGFVGDTPSHSFVTSDFWAQGFNFGVLIGF